MYSSRLETTSFLTRKWSPEPIRHALRHPAAAACSSSGTPQLGQGLHWTSVSNFKLPALHRRGVGAHVKQRRSRARSLLDPETDVRWKGSVSSRNNGALTTSRRSTIVSAANRAGNASSSESFEVEEDFERWERDELAAILARDRELSVAAKRRDPWDSDSFNEDDAPSTSGQGAVQGGVSAEAVSVLGGSNEGASYPVSSHALSSESSGQSEEPIKVAVPAQDAHVTGIEVLRLLAELDKKQQAEKAQTKRSWFRRIVHEASTLLLFLLGWIRTTLLATFHFLAKQPGELFNLSWPTPGETVNTMTLVTGTILVLLVFISTMDVGFTYVLAALVRRSA